MLFGKINTSCWLQLSSFWLLLADISLHCFLGLIAIAFYERLSFALAKLTKMFDRLCVRTGVIAVIFDNEGTLGCEFIVRV